MNEELFGVALLAAILGLIPAFIASGKGRFFIGWWLFGTLLFIVALPTALLVSERLRPQQERDFADRTIRCPDCGEEVKVIACVCRFCNYRFSKEEIRSRMERALHGSNNGGSSEKVVECFNCGTANDLPMQDICMVCGSDLPNYT